MQKQVYKQTNLIKSESECIQYVGMEWDGPCSAKHIIFVPVMRRFSCPFLLACHRPRSTSPARVKLWADPWKVRIGATMWGYGSSDPLSTRLY